MFPERCPAPASRPGDTPWRADGRETELKGNGEPAAAFRAGNDPYQQQGSPASDCPEKMWSALESLEASKNDPYQQQVWYEEGSPTSDCPEKLWDALESLGSLPTAGLVPSGIAHLRLSQEDVESPGIPGGIQK
ncbi:hypothetical protein DUI87_04807 [Hirundo rustica rustica]|uniref:Uncharacterized protein n=1 Tax=Hirundo rustica rustica TaxID=333673 RepID=A0A3M0L7A1_HIRRU|nr:hypothetical protein DUI87_04807 [Hirundo rustica rustica]